MTDPKRSKIVDSVFVLQALARFETMIRELKMDMNLASRAATASPNV